MNRYRIGIFVAGLVLALATPGISAAASMQYPRQVIKTVGTCTVTEMLRAEQRVFIHCGEEGGNTWLMMSQYALDQPLEVGDEVRYKMVNVSGGYYIKALDRTLPTMWHVYNFTITAGRRDANPPQSASGREDGVYAGTDDSGALVFSDNPGNVPKKKPGGKKKQ